MKRIALLLVATLLVASTLAQTTRTPAPDRNGWEEDWGLYGDVVSISITHCNYTSYFQDHIKSVPHKTESYTFNADGNVVEYTVTDSETDESIFYSYDSNGRNTTADVFQSKKLQSRIVKEYNEQGVLIQEATYDPDGILQEISFPCFNSRGHLIEQTTYNGNGDLEYVYYNEFNERGDLTKGELYRTSDMELPIISITLSHTYDNAGNITKTLVSSGSAHSLWEYNYDQQGRLIEELCYNPLTEKLEKKYVHTYDEQGNITETICQEPRFDGRVMVPISSTEYKIDYKGDGNEFPAPSDTFEFADFSEEENIIEEAVVKEEVKEEQVFVKVEKMPSFAGGDFNTFRAWVGSEFKYPAIAAENGIQGRLVVQFVIEKDGRLTNIQFLQSPDPVFNEEVTRVLKKSPKWTPGYQQGKPVRVSYVLPIDICLQ